MRKPEKNCEISRKSKILQDIVSRIYDNHKMNGKITLVSMQKSLNLMV